MRRVADAVRALRLELREVALVRRERALVGGRGVGIPPDAHVDVRRHVQEVPRPGHEGLELLRTRQRAPWRRGRFHEVNPVVVRAWMFRRNPQRRGEEGFDLRSPGLRRAVAFPPVVRVQVELRLGCECQHVGVARIRLGERAHPLGVAFLVDDARLRVARSERGDQRAMAGRGVNRQRLGAAHRGLHARGVDLLHVGVDRRPERPREPPEAERTLRVRTRGRVERSRGLRRVEAPCEHHALVEIALRARHWRSGGEGVAPHAVEERRGFTRERGRAQRRRGACSRKPGKEAGRRLWRPHAAEG